MLDRTKERNVTFKLMSLDGTFETQFLEATTVKQITKEVVPVPFDPHDLPHLANIQFTEDFPRDEHQQVDIMIGEPYYS